MNSSFESKEQALQSIPDMICVWRLQSVLEAN